MRFALFLTCCALFLGCPFLAHAADGTASSVTVTSEKTPSVIKSSSHGAIVDTVPMKTYEAARILEGEVPDGQFPSLRLTPDKIEVVRLDKDAGNVIVGNSKHLMAVMETPRQLLLIPRAPGATHFQVLGPKGNTVMERTVIVAAPTPDYIRVRRTCKPGRPCKEYSVFYCPDICHMVSVTQDDQGGDRAVRVPNAPASGGAGSQPPEGKPLGNENPVSGEDVPANIDNAVMMP